MGSMKDVATLYQSLKTEWSKKPRKLDKCGELLNRIKVKMTMTSQNPNCFPDDFHHKQIISRWHLPSTLSCRVIIRLRIKKSWFWLEMYWKLEHNGQSLWKIWKPSSDSCPSWNATISTTSEYLLSRNVFCNLWGANLVLESLVASSPI